MESNFEKAKLAEYQNKLWIKCPYCGRLMFPIDEDTVIQNFKYYCKNSKCKRTMIIDIEPKEPSDT